MGEVYLADDTGLDRQVALKFLSPILCQDKDFRMRFKREAQAAARLNHPNIVTIHEVGEYQDRPFFAMRHVDGQSLKNLIEQGELDQNEVVNLSIQISEGLREAHSAGVLHRDIKPSNIIVDTNGRPILLDFGLAAIQGSEKLTRTGSRFGTSGYMSPEQIESGQTDERSDLFSLGVLIYEMITGKSPFMRDSYDATMHSILTDTPEPLAKYTSGASDELQRIVTKLLDKDPSLRYQTASDVVTDLKRLSLAQRPETSTDRTIRMPKYLLIGVVLLAIAVIIAIIEFSGGDSDKMSVSRKMIAVLPFENLGPADYDYFAAGMTEEIRSKLTTLIDLGVTSGKSANAYKDSDKTLPQIARELGVDYVLEGSILWDETASIDRVRITSQLIRVDEDRHIWSESYEQELTQIFIVQSDIAERIAEALDIVLLEPERRVLESRPTDNIEAHDFYLRGLEYDDRHEFEFAEEMFEKAIELDPGYALAYAGLSQVHSYVYWSGKDRTPERIGKARVAAGRALIIDPNLADGHLALGYCYYYAGRDYDLALEEFTRALTIQPGNSELLSAVAYVKRRQGEWPETLDLLQQAVTLDPRSISKSANLVISNTYMRRYDAALNEIDRILSLYPDFAWGWGTKALIQGLSMGDTVRARITLEDSDGKIDPGDVRYELWQLDVTVGNFEAALHREERQIDQLKTAVDSGSYYSHFGRVYLYSGDRENSRIFYDSARACFESELLLGRTGQEQAEAKMALARALAGLGRKADAIRLGREAVNELPVSTDAYKGSDLMRDLCLVYVWVEEYDQAIDLVEQLLAMPSPLSIAEIRLHPRWAPLRSHPRVRALMARYET
jgi:serine/threonine protein kinase/Tfp pilus assembly protein PilF